MPNRLQSGSVEDSRQSPPGDAEIQHKIWFKMHLVNISTFQVTKKLKNVKRNECAKQY